MTFLQDFIWELCRYLVLIAVVVGAVYSGHRYRDYKDAKNGASAAKEKNEVEA